MVDRCRILLDTNFLIGSLTGGTDILSMVSERYPHCELFTLDRCVQEAKSLENGRFSGFVDHILETYAIGLVREAFSGSVDDQLVSLAPEFLIATNDRELRRRIRQGTGRSVYVRQHKYLEED